MKQSSDERLVSSYPILYQQRYKSIHETCMSWGFDVGDGWVKIIDTLSDKLEKINKLIMADPEIPPDEKSVVKAEQVKEKFGGLRFYTSGGHSKYYEDIEHAIRVAEIKADVTCEYCGRPGKPTSTGWIKTLCHDCYRRAELAHRKERLKRLRKAKTQKHPK